MKETQGTVESSGCRGRPRRFFGVAVAMLVLVGSAILMPSRPALAETTLGDPIQTGDTPLGVAVNPTTNRVYVVNLLSNNVTVIDGATSSVVGSPITVGRQPAGVEVNP